MIRASALYMVIVMALVIAILCASLIAVAYYFRQQNLSAIRYDRLENNLGSAVNILLADSAAAEARERPMSLFPGQNDSVSLSRFTWGLFDVGVARAYWQKDTLRQAFIIGHPMDTTKWAALYVPDEDRALAVSGKTAIRGNAVLPKGGIRAAFIENQAYVGDKRIILGKTAHSQKAIPAVDQARISELERYFGGRSKGDQLTFNGGPVIRTFLGATGILKLGKIPIVLSGTTFKGKVLILSDTTVTIDSSARLENVIIAARSIFIKDGFKGICQLFARDTILAGDRCRFDYPSCIGLLPSGRSPEIQKFIGLGRGCRLYGTIFTRPEPDNERLPLIKVEESCSISGQVYSEGSFLYRDHTILNGSIYTRRFLYLSKYKAFENALVNITIDASGLSSYYLTGMLLPGNTGSSKVLQWLETK